MAAREMFDVAAGTSMAGTPASFTAPVSGSLLVTVAVSADDTLRVNKTGRTPQAFGGGTSLGVNQIATFVYGVKRDQAYEFTFSTGAGTIEFLTGVLETDQVA